MMNFSEGNQALIAALEYWNIKHAFGVNGGGVIHLLKWLPSSISKKPINDKLQFITLSEYVAGFAPIGYYLASERIAATITTTGAAIKLASCGLSDSRFMHIPSLYIFSLNTLKSNIYAPLQDSGEYGMNIIAQLKTEFSNNVYVLDDISQFSEKLRQIAVTLSQSKPAVFLFYPDVMCQPVTLSSFPSIIAPNEVDFDAFSKFIFFLRSALKENKKIVLYICSEASYQQKIYPLIEIIKQKLNVIVVCSVNGSSAAGKKTKHHYGHVGLGGSERGNEIWSQLNERDVLITLGMDAGEYCFMQNELKVGECWCFTNQTESYGTIKDSYQHRFQNNFHIIHGPLEIMLNLFIQELATFEQENLVRPLPMSSYIPEKRKRKNRPDYVDLVDFYQKLTLLWKKNSIGFDDICLAYRDRQYIMETAHPNIRFFSAQDGSAMGGAFGLLIGAKISEPTLHCFAFSGDGCWRLYGASLAEASELGVVLFIMDNGEYGLVREGLDKIIPGLPASHKHTFLHPINFVAAARAHGWEALSLKPDLSNLEKIMIRAYKKNKRSLLIEVPVDPTQILGSNPRYQNLMKKNFL